MVENCFYLRFTIVNFLIICCHFLETLTFTFKSRNSQQSMVNNFKSTVHPIHRFFYTRNILSNSKLFHKHKSISPFIFSQFKKKIHCYRIVLKCASCSAEDSRLTKNLFKISKPDTLATTFLFFCF